ncbi:class I SAM-dependent methyltransferase [Aliidiomarina quisquiliarum]|uniref:class I SAM-dependent methyltransferase n=1 Tax=Aliidiomarina quisquiliarum TaxID=2938947 RepID=UPI00208EA64F|nr:class I SAM-dependent methyltransferase [Aliidiomarina quisquiliarum]MCO4321365.1 methyltransferase domain-containing protein [Aliidiomarina quisquiliarum]
MGSKNITYYSTQAEQLSAQYDSLNFTDVHSNWLQHLPSSGWVLDVGAGSGRDSAYLANKGLHVVAVEPANGMRELAQLKHKDANIHWINDTLPELKSVFALQIKFDLILLSAVWMHIPPSSRERAFRKLSSLLKPNGKLVISLRHSTSENELHEDRVMYQVSTSEQAQLANKFGLSFQEVTSQKQADKLGRDHVYWQTVVLTLPDDGTGAFPLIRHIAVNDTKTSTYKLALLRCILRIAEGHPGAVINQTDDTVELPLGLVAFYWLKLYRPLVDTYDMQQNSNSNSGLGFVKPAGWSALKPLASADLYLGALITGGLTGDANSAAANVLHRTLKDISQVIRNMPVKYITLPGTDEAVFAVETKPTPNNLTSLILDSDYLASLGSFYIPTHVWDAMAQFSVWIEPTLLNEWVNLMEGYGRNKARELSRHLYFNALRWDDPERKTSHVRNRVDSLLNEDKVYCVWSSKRIRLPSEYAVDHAFPYARWPNNDLWNLVPATSRVNARKSDKLPSAAKLNACRSQIIDWWQLAWGQNNTEFFAQAILALPHVSKNSNDFEEVFEAFALQRNRIRELQQLAEWF